MVGFIKLYGVYEVSMFPSVKQDKPPTVLRELTHGRALGLLKHRATAIFATLISKALGVSSFGDATSAKGLVGRSTGSQTG